MSCYVNLISQLTWEERLGVVLGETHQDVGLIPWDGDCEHKHGAKMGREIRAKAAASLAGRSRQRVNRKQKASDEKDNTDEVEVQGTLFR